MTLLTLATSSRDVLAPRLPRCSNRSPRRAAPFWPRRCIASRRNTSCCRCNARAVERTNLLTCTTSLRDVLALRLLGSSKTRTANGSRPRSTRRKWFANARPCAPGCAGFFASCTLLLLLLLLLLVLFWTAPVAVPLLLLWAGGAGADLPLLW